MPCHRLGPRESERLKRQSIWKEYKKVGSPRLNTSLSWVRPSVCEQNAGVPQAQADTAIAQGDSASDDAFDEEKAKMGAFKLGSSNVVVSASTISSMSRV